MHEKDMFEDFQENVGRPAKVKLGEAMASLSVGAFVAQAHASYYQTLRKQGIEAERAERMTEVAMKSLLASSADIIRALKEVIADLPPVLDAINRLTENEVVQALSGMHTGDPR